MTTTPPGWYADPSPPAGHAPALRWWDGQRWTEHLAARPTGQTPGQPSSSRATHTDDGEELAGWGARLAAYLVDAVVSFVALLLLGLPWLLDVVAYVRDEYGDFFQTGLADDPALQPPSQVEMVSDLAGPLLALQVLSVLILVVYHGGFLRARGATPGKMLVGLRVRPVEAPGRLGWGTVARRLAIWVVVGLLGWVPVLGLLLSLVAWVDGLWPLWDKRRQALHDKLARTQVVRARR